MQIYYYGYGNNKDIVRACAWARNAQSDLLDHELLKLKSKIDSEKMSSDQMKECDLLSEKMKNELKNNYEDWLQNHSIVDKDEAQKILDEYHIQF